MYQQDSTKLEEEKTTNKDDNITKNPTPKLRTMFSNYEVLQEGTVTNCHQDNISNDSCSAKANEKKDIVPKNAKSPSLKWKRRSIKQASYESDDDQNKGKQPLTVIWLTASEFTRHNLQTCPAVKFLLL